MDSFNPVLPAVQPAAPVDSSLTRPHDAPSSSVVAAEVASLDNFTDESGKRQGFLVKLYTMIEEADQDVVAWENGALSLCAVATCLCLVYVCTTVFLLLLQLRQLKLTMFAVIPKCRSNCDAEPIGD